MVNLSIDVQRDVKRRVIGKNGEEKRSARVEEKKGERREGKRKRGVRMRVGGTAHNYVRVY